MAKQYQALWDFPHCMGAIDGKHVVLRCPRNSASEYFNYKNAFSIVFFALVDANYNFVCQRRMSGKNFWQGWFYENSAIYKPRNKNLRSSSASPFKWEREKCSILFYCRWCFSFKREAYESLSWTTSKRLKRTNFQLQDLQSPKSCRKCIWPRVIGVPSASYTYTFGTKKAQLVAMTIACLHNFLRSSPDLAAIYTPPSTFDYEENSRVIEGSWRAMSNENMTYILLERMHVNQLWRWK